MLRFAVELAEQKLQYASCQMASPCPSSAVNIKMRERGKLEITDLKGARVTAYHNSS